MRFVVFLALLVTACEQPVQQSRVPVDPVPLIFEQIRVGETVDTVSEALSAKPVKVNAGLPHDSELYEWRIGQHRIQGLFRDGRLSEKTRERVKSNGETEQ